MMSALESDSTNLSADESAALDEFLARPGGPNLDVAVGFLTAVVSAPNPIPPGEWVAPVLGERGPEDTTAGLLLRLYNTLEATLARGQVLAPPADQPEDIEQFCIGYLMGVGLDPEWLDLPGAMDHIYPIAVLSGHDLGDQGGVHSSAEGEKFKRQARDELADIVVELHEQMAPYRARKTSGGAGQPQAKTKLGRNDPCPCGSGKKYKRCCLGQVS